MWVWEKVQKMSWEINSSLTASRFSGVSLAYNILFMSHASSIVGHQFQIEQLTQDIESKNIAHAYLFVGPAHIGKMSIAHWFAKRIISQDLSSENVQVSHEQCDRLLHPDLIVLDQLWMHGVNDDWDVLSRSSNVNQQHRSKSKAKTDTISIDDVRVLQERLYEKSTGMHSCCIIRSVERLQDTAANAFLKILEEPPPGKVFILTTSSLSALLPTFVSRTRRVLFHKLPVVDMSKLLQDADPEDVQFILHMSQGAPGKAIRLRDDPDTAREQRLLHSKALSFWKTKSLSERLRLLEPLHERGEDAQQFLMHLNITLRIHKPKNWERYQKELIVLIKGLNTNVNRQLLSQNFALNVTHCHDLVA
jgi:DNA polymerase III subunit delta'